jgi:para-aminobenzoate synthetase/4-amino-4-deoxychorismate lyase
VTLSARASTVRSGGLCHSIAPPLECGLLDGTLRKWMLDSQAMPTSECVLTVADLASADRIFLANSVRALLEVRL